MREYEVSITYLNGCSGEAYPQISIEEICANSPEEYLRGKHGKQFEQFTREVGEDGREVYTFANSAVKYIYDFLEL